MFSSTKTLKPLHFLPLSGLLFYPYKPSAFSTLPFSICLVLFFQQEGMEGKNDH